MARPKPEHMTHLRGDILVRKDHPRIAFRGMIDALEAELLLCGRKALNAGCTVLANELGEMLDFTRNFIRCDVLGEPMGEWRVCGYTPEELREYSHYPERYFGQPHFMAAAEDCELILYVNRTRTVVRQTELAAYRAFKEPNGDVNREDIIRGLNRLSSLCWIQMIRLKAGKYEHTGP